MRRAPGRRAGAALLGVGLTVGLGVGGCVERTIFITSDPPGALVHLNDVEVGVTPVEVGFTWYGVYDVRVEKDGYEPLMTSARARAPFWEAPGIDLIAAMAPGHRQRAVRWSFTLTKADDDPDAVVERARSMRATAFEAEALEPGAPPK